MIAKWLAGKTKWTVIVTGVITTVALLGLYAHKVNTLEDRVAVLELEKHTLTVQNENYLTIIEHQSGRILELKHRSDEYQARFDGMEKKLAVTEANHTKALQTLRKKKAPKDAKKAIEWMVERTQEDLSWKK